MATNVKKIRELGAEALQTEVGQLREQLFKLRWQAAGGTAENPRKIREVRRDIARHLTIAQQLKAAEKAGEQS